MYELIRWISSRLPIESPPQFPDSATRRTKQDLYRVIQQCALLIAGFAIIAVAAALLPRRANAFWPFSTNADAASGALVPSSTTPVLAATLNSNPGVGAPTTLATSGGSALVAYSGPSGTIADVATTTQSDRISVYVVRPGDTLSEIGAMFGVSVNTIIWANNLKSNTDIQPGETLIILPVSGVEHTVAKGDTLKSVASKYGADAAEIAQYNGLDPAAALVVGSVLTIPGGELSVPTSRKTGTSVRRQRVSGTRSSGGIYEPYLGGSGAAQPGYFGNPLPGGIITQSIHGWNAIDIGAPRGTPIHAAAAGTIIVARDNGAWNGGYGNYVVITHGNGTQTLYAHMTRTAVSPGESVSEGQIIGYVGMTGWATGPHLHFEVRGAANPFRNCPVGRACSLP